MNNQRGAIGMTVGILVVLGYVALLITAFWIANAENGKAARANKKADDMMAMIGTINTGLSEIKSESSKTDEQFRKLVESILVNNSEIDKMKQKIEWLEMKANAKPIIQSALPIQSKVLLVQEKPLQVSVIYRQAVKKPPTGEVQAKKALIKNVKKKLDELSQ